MEFGLTQKFPKKSRCDRCDGSLEFSIFNDISIVFSTSRNSTNGFVCVRCATYFPKSKARPPKVTLREVEEFTQNCTPGLKH